jgi:hypothetical protein
MSELVAARQHGNYRHLLLGGASAIALLVAAAAPALADDQNHFYIELGGQYGFEAGGSTEWFGVVPPAGGEGFYSGIGPDEFRSRSKHSWNIDGAVKFQPAGTDLIFKAGVQYGRTKSEHKGFDFTYYTSTDGSGYTHVTGGARHREEHVKVDFQVGKDFGLGMFGNNGGTSIFSAGIRYAQFNAHTGVNLNFTTSTKYTGTGSGVATRRFSGVGPMISWEASAPISNDGFSLDWGAEAAVLFGRQKTYFAITYSDGYTEGGARHRNKTVPEVGGFMGLSWTCPDAPAKFTLGYKVDALFNLYDGGFFTPVDTDRITHGPFVKVGISVN